MINISMEGEGHTQIAVTVPLFLKKLWKMVNDKEAEDIIGWNTTGDGFVIYDQLQFITKLLPHYFKHNNMASFIRQLNFYDFHKVAGIDKDEIHFSHNCFLKDLPETLIFIKRKCTSVKSKLTNNAKEEELNELLSGVKDLKTKHALVDNELKLLKQENAALWNEINNLRVKHSKQTKIINKIIHFLISYMHSQNSLSKRNGVGTRKGSQKNLKTGPTILEIDYHNHQPDVVKHKQNSYTVPESSGAITYNIQSQNESNVQPAVANSIDEILNSSESGDRTSSLNKWVRAGSLNVNIQNNQKVDETLENSKPKNLPAPKVCRASKVSVSNISPITLTNSRSEELENSLTAMLNSKSDNLGSTVKVSGSAGTDTWNPSQSKGAENFGATTLNSKNNNLTTSKLLENPNDNFGLYFSDNETTPLPLKNPIKFSKILDNPKENLGIYLNNIQMELNSLQDMLSNLSAAELSNFCSLMESMEPDIKQNNLGATTDIEVANMDQITKEHMGMISENNEERVSKDTLADEFITLPTDSNLNDVNNENNLIVNEQFTQDNMIPEVLVDEYFNTEF